MAALAAALVREVGGVDCGHPRAQLPYARAVARLANRDRRDRRLLIAAGVQGAVIGRRGVLVRVYSPFAKAFKKIISELAQSIALASSEARRRSAIYFLTRRREWPMHHSKQRQALFKLAARKAERDQVPTW
jgi:hypothetical protein